MLDIGYILRTNWGFCDIFDKGANVCSSYISVFLPNIFFTHTKMEIKKKKQVGFWRCELGHIKWNKLKSITS